MVQKCLVNKEKCKLYAEPSFLGGKNYDQVSGVVSSFLMIYV